MPPPPDPWDPHVPSLLEDAEPSRHANTLDPDDPEASHFLDNLDMSAFEPCDFDFSSLMDLDQIDDAALLDIPDPDMTDMSMMPIGDSNATDLPVPETSDFQSIATFDPDSSQVFGQAWVHDAPGAAEFGFPAIEAPGSFPTPSDATNVLSPSLDSNNLRLPENCHSWGHGGNTSQFQTVSNSSRTIPISHAAPAPSYFCETATPAPVLGEYGQGTQSSIPQPATGPVFHNRRPLPPARRGGRRGRPTREQAERQLMARANGVCIRCRFARIACEGGFPCEACLSVRKPRLWRSPCTKAQFLEIVESESFFLRASILRNVWIDTLDIESAKSTLEVFKELKHKFSVVVLGDFRKPSPGRIREVEKQLLREYPSGIAVDFLREPQRTDEFHWAYMLTFFCSGQRFSNPREEDAIIPLYPWIRLEFSPINRLLWLYCRYGELCLFNYLQEKANNPGKATEDQKMFIYSALFILKHSVSQGHLESLGTSLDGHDIQREVEDHLDRQTRVRTALWIFASVFVSKLPAHTDFWNHLPQEVDFFRRGPRKNMRKSLTDLNTDLLVSSDDIFSQKRKVLKHLFAAQDRYRGTQQEIPEQNDSRFLWSAMLSITPQGIREIEHMSASPPADLADRIRLYQQDEAERVMIPKTREQRNEAARRFFGGLLSMSETPIIQNGASLYLPNGSLRPSCLRFMIFLARYLRRIPGRYAYHRRKLSGQRIAMWYDVNLLVHEAHEAISRKNGAVGCVKSSQRWLKLANLLGDAAYLMGTTEQLCRHPFLDIVSIVELGTDDEFSRLESLILRNGSWIRAACIQLNGLAQAICQASDTNRLTRMRAFQHLLQRKCRKAFGEDVSEPGGKLSDEHRFIVEHMGKSLLDFIPPPSEVEEGHRWVRDILELAILEAIEDTLRGKHEAPGEVDHLLWIAQPLAQVMDGFSRLYGQGIEQRGSDHWPEPERMIPLLREAAEKFADWYVPAHSETELMSQGTKEEALKAFRDIIDC